MISQFLLHKHISLSYLNNKQNDLIKIKAEFLLGTVLFILLIICTICWFNSIYTFSHGYKVLIDPHGSQDGYLQKLKHTAPPPDHKSAQKALEFSKTLPFVLSSSPPRKGLSLLQQLLTKF